MTHHQPNHTLEPFWSRIPQFFLYGLKPAPLVLASAITALSLVLGGGVIAFLITSLIILKYSMVALQNTAEGHSQPPKLSFDVLVSQYELPLKLFLVIIIYVLIIASLSPIVSILLSALGLLMLPAIVIGMAFTERFMFAINPINAFSIMKQIGWPYLIMFVFLFLLSSAEGVAQQFLMTGTSENPTLSLIRGINTLFSVISFHMMGYVLLQYHEELGYSAHGDMVTEAKKISPSARRYWNNSLMKATSKPPLPNLRASPVNIQRTSISSVAPMPIWPPTML